MNAFIFNSITIEDAGGGNALTYNVTPVEERGVTIGYGATEIDDSQELASLQSVEVYVDTFDEDIISDTRLTQNASDVKSPARITMNSASGGVSVMVDSIRLRLVQKVGDRATYCIKGQRKASMMTNAQEFRLNVQRDGGTIVALSQLSILNSMSGASLICPCNAGKAGSLYYTDSTSALITFT
jgi:hypothetical protein